MRALTVAVAVAALVGGCASGCASIPESTPVQVVGENVDGGEEEPVVAAPLPGLDELQVVREFVEASASQANEHAAAREYLTTDAARSWNDTVVTYLIEDKFDTTPTAQDGPDADQRRVVDLRIRQLGRLDRAGVFKLERRELRFTVNLVRDAGEWRIANPPAGLLMRLVDFRDSYRAVGLAYVDASSSALVNDRRWVLSWPDSALPSRVIDLLLGEPSEDLAGAVINELRGASTKTNVAVGPDNVLTVDLTGLQPLNETQRDLAAAQIVRSLDDILGPTDPVRIYADGEPLTPGRPQWRPADAAQFQTSLEVSAGLPGLIVTSTGQVVRIGSGGQLPSGMPPVVQSVAQSADGDQFAAVALEDGRSRLWVGPTRGELQAVDLPADSMSEPSWRRDRDEVWTVVDGNRLMAVAIGDGQPRAYAVDAAELSRQGTISEVRISPDGVRVAAIVNDKLLVGSIVGGGAQSRVRNVRALPPPNPTQLVDVDWIGTDLLVMATAGRDTPVYEASVDGFAWRSFGTSNLVPPVTRITAVLDRPVLVTDQNGVWQANTASSVWQPVGHGPGAVPVYPG